MYYVYILKSSKDNKIYTGYSADLRKRLQEHIDGKVISTASRRPLKLIYYEGYLSETDARKRELYLKSGGKAKITLKKQIKNSLSIGL